MMVLVMLCCRALLAGLQIATCANEPTLQQEIIAEIDVYIHNVMLFRGLCNVVPVPVCGFTRSKNLSCIWRKAATLAAARERCTSALHAFPADLSAGRRSGQPLFVRDNRTVTRPKR